MGRKKVVTEETFELGEEADAEVALTDPNQPIDDELADLIGEDADDTKYTVHRMPTKPGEKVGYCNTYTRGDLSLDTIRATFGGGQYRITGRNAKNQYVRSKLVTLIDLPKTAGVLGGAPNADLAAVLAAAKGGGNDMMPVLLEMIRSQGAAQAAMFAAIGNRPEPAAPTGPTFMEILSLIKEMNHKPDDSAVKVLLQGLELGQKLGGGGETGMLDVAKQGLEMLSPIIARENAPRPVQRPQQPRPNGQAPQSLPASDPGVTPQPNPTAERPNPMLQKLNWLRSLTANLVVHAVKDHDPETYAEVVLDNLPPFVTEEEILERLTPDNAVGVLAQLNPDVAKYPVWFEEFRQAVLRFLTEEDEAPVPNSPDGEFVPTGEEQDLEP